MNQWSTETLDDWVRADKQDRAEMNLFIAGPAKLATSDRAIRRDLYRWLLRHVAPSGNC